MNRFHQSLESFAFQFAVHRHSLGPWAKCQPCLQMAEFVRLAALEVTAPERKSGGSNDS